MYIHEIIKHIQDNDLSPCKIKHGKFEGDDYISVDGDYPNFYAPLHNELIHWYPSLDDLMANDWEIIQITVLDLAVHRGAKYNDDGNISAGEIEKTGLPFFGGCSVCGASIAAYNACPSRSGFLKCSSECIGDDGFANVELANKVLFDEQS